MTLEKTLKNFKRNLTLFNEFYVKPLIPNLEGKQARRSLILAAGLTLGGVISEIAQAYTLSGKAESVPSLAHLKGNVTFTDTSNSQQYVAPIDTLTGAFSTDVPAGTYERKLQLHNNFEVIDTIAVNNNLTMDSLQAIENLSISSTYHSNVLGEVKTLTFTRDSDPDKEIERWIDSDRPMNVFPRNYNPADTLSMPDSLRQCFDFATNQIIAKSDSIVQFNETSSQNAIGSNIEYRRSSQMTIPGVNGYTAVEESYADGSPKKIRIEINRETVLPSSGHRTFLRELMRALRTVASSPDPSFIMGSSSTATQLHDDEGIVLQMMYTLHNQTNMFKHKNIVYNGVEGSSTEPSLIAKPYYNSFPNPFDRQVTFEYRLSDREKVKLEIYNLNGQRVKVIADTYQTAEMHQLQWNGKNNSGEDLSSGVYIARLTAGNNIHTRKLLKVR